MALELLFSHNFTCHFFQIIGMKYICQILGLALSPPPSQHLQPHPHQLSYTLSTSQHNNNLLTTTIAMQQQQQHADRSSSPVRSRQRHQESGIFIFLKSRICNKSNIKMNNKFEANYKWRINKRQIKNGVKQYK